MLNAIYSDYVFILILNIIMLSVLAPAYSIKKLAIIMSALLMAHLHERNMQHCNC